MNRTTRRRCGLAIGAIVIIGLSVADSASAALPNPDDVLTYAGDFESGDLSGWGNSRNNTKVAVVSSPARAGSKATRIALSYFDEYAGRTEILPAPTPSPPGPNAGGGGTASPWYPSFRNDFAVGAEYWYGMSFYLPGDWVVDPDDKPANYGDDDILAQWHERRDAHLGELSRQPPLTIRIEGNQWKVVRRWDSKANTTVNGVNVYEGTREYAIAPFVTNRWTDWVVHVKWSYESDGFLEVWKDGTKVLDVDGPVGFNDVDGLYLKTGIYKPAWNSQARPGQVTSRTAYYDEYRIADQRGSYEAVAPGPTVFQSSVNAAGTAQRTHKVTVTSPRTLALSLDWLTSTANLDLIVRDPNGAQFATSATTGRPERLAVDANAPGAWSIVVKATSGSTKYRLSVRAGP